MKHESRLPAASAQPNIDAARISALANDGTDCELPIVTDLRAAGLRVEEHEWDEGVWRAQCPHCVAQDWPDPSRLCLGVFCSGYGEPIDYSCEYGCRWAQIMGALRELIESRLAVTAAAEPSPAIGSRIRLRDRRDCGA